MKEHLPDICGLGAKAVLSRAWRGVPRRVMNASGTALHQHRARKRGSATSDSSPITRGFYDSPGCCNILLDLTNSLKTLSAAHPSF